jgi:hypothetical protein
MVDLPLTAHNTAAGTPRILIMATLALAEILGRPEAALATLVVVTAVLGAAIIGECPQMQISLLVRRW